MTVYTEGRHAAEFVLSEANGGRSRDNITIVSGAGVVKVGTVLGKITTGGKYTPSPATGADGSQTGAAINLYEVDATSADVAVAAIVRHAEVNKNLLVYEGTVDQPAEKVTKNGELATVGIITR